MATIIDGTLALTSTLIASFENIFSHFDAGDIDVLIYV